MKIEITKIYEVEIKQVNKNTWSFKVAEFEYHLIELSSDGNIYFEVYNTTSVKIVGTYKTSKIAKEEIEILLEKDLL